MTLLGRRVGSGRTSPSGARAYGLLVKRSAGLGTINRRYKLSNTLHYTHTYRHFTHTTGMRIGPVHDTGLSAVLWSSIPATASIVAPQEQNRTGLAAEYRSRRWVWSSVVLWSSDVYDTHRWTKLTSLETISRSRDMVGAHQSLNGFRDLTMPIWGMICHPWLALATVSLLIKFEVSVSTHDKDIKGNTECRNGWFGVVRVTQGHWK